MAINYQVQAEVINLAADFPKPDDAFFIDTNVWYWLTYHPASQVHQPSYPYQVQHYPAYIHKARQAKARLYYCGLSLAELAHQIEKAEREIYIQTTAAGRLLPKAFRHNYPAERSQVVAQVRSCWAQVKTIAAPLELLINETVTDAALQQFQHQPVDGYDLFILESITRAGIVQAITDDGDFSTMPGIQVFTANRQVLQAAQQRGKLLAR